MNISPTEYELFVREFHEKLLRQDGFENLEVKHNVKIKGKSGNKNQIDVYWEVVIAGVTQKFCVECKKWKNRVRKSDVGSFISTINDIGGARGIYVTTKGFQPGAIKLAEENQIILIEATPEITRTPATLEIYLKQVTDVSIEFSKDIHGERLDTLNRFISSPLISNELDTIFYDSHGVNLMRANDFYSFLSDSYEEAGVYSKDIFELYIKIDGELFQCKTVSYQIVLNKISGAELNGYSETAELLAKYISENKEVKQKIDDYNRRLFS
ncbi:TPA: restriction endonuclease [Aeromonas veronii]